MKDKIKIEIISDVVCPWCIIGYKRLENAIVELGIENKIQIEWKSFELNPNLPLDGENVIEHMGRKYNMSKNDVKQFQSNITNLGMESGFKFDNFNHIHVINTRDVHVLLHFAKKFEKQTELKIRLFTSIFSEGKDLSNKEVLKQELLSVGLDANKAFKTLNDENRYEIQRKEENLHNLGINSVPTMILNNSTKLTGAQSVDYYKEVLKGFL